MTTEYPSAIAVGLRFLVTLFSPTDFVHFRPIETWTEHGRKRSRVIHGHASTVALDRVNLSESINQLHQVSELQSAHVFFGVCPRYGGDKKFELAWQIRTVRALWTDIDHISVDEAAERISKASLPDPSILVNSGNGVHVYWLLDQPYLIDDASDPLPVEIEWTVLPGARKSPRKYVTAGGQRIYLDGRRHISRLSPKAQHLQDVLAGIAQSIGGDHTTDLARLLRLPGTFNRKDQRNGREPVLTAMVACDSGRRHPLAAFEGFKITSPGSERAKKIVEMPLPRHRRLSNSRSDKLLELVATCSIAPEGGRSEADFAVCCYAIRSGIEKENLWAEVEQVGKFAEQGRRYFETTWENAEYEVRAEIFDKLQKRAGPKRPCGKKPAIAASECGGSEPPVFDAEEEQDAGHPTIVVESQTMPVGDTLHQVTDRLLFTRNCFTRADQLVVINDEQISPILTSSELAGLLNQHVEFYFVEKDSGEFKPFPAAYGNTWLNQRAERSRLPTVKLFTRNPVYTEDWRVVTPGYDAQSEIYYAGQAVTPSLSTEHLDALLKDFCFKSPADRTNYLGVLLTAILIPQFIGSKPAALFNGNQPELGKSILAQIIAILRDGQSAETASYNPNDEEFEKRLGAIVRRGATTIIIDNAKSRGRNPKIESACLERSITDPILSFRLLGQSASIRAENSHIFAITANAPDVSRDLVTRSVVINLYYEGNPEHREFTIADVEGYTHQHRLSLLAELIGMVERWKTSGMPLARVHTRFNKRGWGNIVGGILNACGEPDFLANAEEAAALLDETRREFTELAGMLADHQQGTWTSAELVDLCARHHLLTTDLGEGSPRSLATKMGNLAGRFVGECFQVSEGREVIFHRSAGRNGHIYRVAVHESAEP